MYFICLYAIISLSVLFLELLNVTSLEPGLYFKLLLLVIMVVQCFLGYKNTSKNLSIAVTALFLAHLVTGGFIFKVFGTEFMNSVIKSYPFMDVGLYCLIGVCGMAFVVGAMFNSRLNMPVKLLSLHVGVLDALLLSFLSFVYLEFVHHIALSEYIDHIMNWIKNDWSFFYNHWLTN